MYKKAVSAVAAISAIFVITPQKIQNSQNLDLQVSSASVQSSEAFESRKPSVPELARTQSPPDLTAKAALAIDLRTGTGLYAHNFDVQLPIASLTKMMTAMVVLDNASKDQVVTIEKSDTRVSCLCMGLVPGEQITIENLLKGMLIPSNNDASKALARHVGGDEAKFVAMMNEKSAQLGLASSNFSNPTGLDSEGNYSTALDLSLITQEFLKYSLLERIVATGGEDVTSLDGRFVHKLRTSNKLLLQNSEVVGVKTGFTEAAQGNLIVKIDRNGAEVLVIVLNTPNREDETQKLIDWIFSVYKW